MDTGQTIRIFDPQRGIGMSVEKRPKVKWLVGLVLIRSNDLEISEPLIFELGLN